MWQDEICTICVIDWVVSFRQNGTKFVLKKNKLIMEFLGVG